MKTVRKMAPSRRRLSCGRRHHSNRVARSPIRRGARARTPRGCPSGPAGRCRFRASTSKPAATSCAMAASMAPARTASSRTTPLPARASSRPTSNCGFTRATSSPPLRVQRAMAVASLPRPMNDASTTVRSAGPPIGSGVEGARVGALDDDDPRVDAQLVRELPVADVDRDRRAPRRAAAGNR